MLSWVIYIYIKYIRVTKPEKWIMNKLKDADVGRTTARVKTCCDDEYSDVLNEGAYITR